MHKFTLLFLLSLSLAGCGGQYGGLFDFSPFSSYPAYRLSPAEMYPGNPKAQALVTAAIDGDVKEIDRLIDAGADPNAVGTFAGADPNVVETFGMTVPGWVLYHQNKAGFRRLLERGADPNKIWPQQSAQGSLMHKAAELSPIIGVDYLRMCLEIGKGDPNLEPPDKNDRVIAMAVQPGREEAFALLYNAGAIIDYSSTGFSGYSLVQHAAMSENFPLTLFMLEHGVNYNHRGKVGVKSLHDAMQLALKYSTIPSTPTFPEYMWFWRCVDWLERHGMVFDYTPDKGREPAIRPAVLDTTAPDPFHALPAPVQEPPKNLSWMMQEVNLTSPLPVWADTPETRENVKSRQRQKTGIIIIEYLPKDQTESNWKVSYTISSAYTPGTTLDETEQMLRKTLGAGVSVTTEERASDHCLLSFVIGDAAKTEGLVYLGRFKDTIVTVREVWRSVDAATASAYRAKALAGMRQVVMKKGLTVLPMN